MADLLTCLIVEDEVMSRTSLSKLCAKTNELQLLATCENGEEAIAFLRSNDVDLIFLDINMPGMSGLDLVESMTSTPQIIFITGSKEYAYEAFELDVTDFVVKPITPGRFQRAVDKAIKRQKLLRAKASVSANNEIYIKTDGKLIRVPLADIHYFENLGDYINVVVDNKKYLILGTMKSIDQKISHSRFLKVHRSYIVNLDKIVDIVDNSILIGTQMIPVSRAHKPILLSTINIL